MNRLYSPRTALAAALVLMVVILVVAWTLPAEADTPPADAIATQTADRLERWQETPLPAPPTTTVGQFAPSGLSDCDEMTWYRVQAGLPAKFDQIGWRESRCINRDDVRTFCCHGWFQLFVSLHLRDHRLAARYAACGIDSADDVNSDTPIDKWRQACAAKAVYDVQPGAWS